MARSIDSIRNIGIIAHIDAGKTTTTERILYYTGASYRMGNVDDGTTQTDFDPEEAQRGITIYSAAVTCEWNDCTINIIDTPGHVDFTAEVERSLRVLDGAVVIFSAVEGVEAQSETVWRQADRYNVPRLCFVNKMDRIGANYQNVLDAMKSRLSAKPLPLQFPIGQGPATNDDGFRGIVDLIRMKALYWDSESRGAEFREDDIPEELSDDAELMRAELLDTLSDIDEELMELHLEEADVPRDVLIRALRAGTIAGEFQPVMCGSSLDYIGVQPVLDAVKDRNAVRLIGTSDAARRAPTVTLALNRNAEAVAADLVAQGIMAGGGDFYAVRPLQAMGVDLEQGVLRVSFTHYTSQQEIDQLLSALDAVL